MVDFGPYAPQAAQDSCLIELHLYQLDSWIHRYLLYSTVGEVLLFLADLTEVLLKSVHFIVFKGPKVYLPMFNQKTNMTKGD